MMVRAEPSVNRRACYPHALLSRASSFAAPTEIIYRYSYRVMQRTKTTLCRCTIHPRRVQFVSDRAKLTEQVAASFVRQISVERGLPYTARSRLLHLKTNCT